MNLHGHVSVFYDNPQDKFEILANYFEDGFKKQELGVFVTATPEKEAIQSFKAAGLNVELYIKDGGLRIFEMLSTYLPNGQFAADFMLNNVVNFIEDARLQGYSGLRTAGEMSWILDHPQFHNEAMHYEGAVNNLADVNSSFTGLCLYALDGDESIIQDALNTHPAFLYDGEVHASPFYSALAA